MATPWANGRQSRAPGDTTNGNEKVVEPGLLGGSSASSCASPTPGASKSAAMYIAVAIFMELSKAVLSACRCILLYLPHDQRFRLVGGKCGGRLFRSGPSNFTS